MVLGQAPSDESIQPVWKRSWYLNLPPPPYLTGVDTASVRVSPPQGDLTAATLAVLSPREAGLDRSYPWIRPDHAPNALAQFEGEVIRIGPSQRVQMPDVEM